MSEVTEQSREAAERSAHVARSERAPSDTLEPSSCYVCGGPRKSASGPVRLMPPTVLVGACSTACGNDPAFRVGLVEPCKWHVLKCIPPYFDEVESGRKPFEVRRNDRGYAVGDGLVLREWDGKAYTGRACSRVISYVLQGGDFGIAPGHCVLGLVRTRLEPIHA